MPPGTYGEHRRFCEIDGWDRRESHHTYFQKRIPDGRFLWTKVSRGKASSQYGKDLWSRVLRQLDVTEEQFNEVLRTRQPLDRRPDKPEKPAGPSLPLWLYQMLREKVGLTSTEIGALSEKEALALWEAWQARPAD